MDVRFWPTKPRTLFDLPAPPSKDGMERSAPQCKAGQGRAVQCRAGQGSVVQCAAADSFINAMKCSAVQCSAVQCSAVQCSAVQACMYSILGSFFVDVLGGLGTTNLELWNSTHLVNKN